jgi:uncharacterized protein (DUF58 family)
MLTASRTLSEQFDPRLLAALEGLDFKARYVMEGFLSGQHDSPFHGFSVEFSDYRNYQPGDDLRHLDWRLFARSDRLPGATVSASSATCRKPTCGFMSSATQALR